jgi:hypothetical protein
VDDAWDVPLQDVLVEVEGEPSQPLCPHCLAETRPAAHFCHVCLCPLTFYAGTAPLERIWAWTWIVGRAGRTSCPRRLHAWGATLVLLPPVAELAVLVASRTAASGTVVPGPWEGLEGGAGLLVSLLLATLGSVLVVRAWRALARAPREPPPDDGDSDAP